MKYNLVILGYSSEYLPIFTELGTHVHQISPFWKNGGDLVRFLLRPDFLPLENSTCYLFFREWYPLFATGYLKKIKKDFPDSKACWFFSDLVSSYPQVNIERMKNEFDLILSFDPEDAERYGFVHCPLPYSIIPQAKVWQKQVLNSDLFFMGKAKQRLDQILAVYETLTAAGLRCDFHIANTPSRLQRFANEIDYCNFLPYRECLRTALSSRCILELLQEPDHHGYTARTAEALVYGRKLLSNNLYLKAAPFYDPKQIHLFSRPEEIDPDFIKDEWQPPCSPALFSPRRTLELIEERLGIAFASAGVKSLHNPASPAFDGGGPYLLNASAGLPK